MWQAIQASGREMVLTVEGHPDDTLMSAGGLGNAKRVGHDISANWPSMTSLVDIDAGLFMFAHNSTNATFGGYWNDIDMLEVGNAPDFVCGQDAAALSRCQVHFSMWCILKAPLILGNDIPNESSATLSVLSNAAAIAVNQDPLGVQAQRVSSVAAAGAAAARAPAAVLARCDASSATQAWSAGADGVLYLVVGLQDGAGVNIGGDGTYWFYPAAGVIVGSASARDNDVGNANQFRIPELDAG
jgi:alpha-galactosidase